MVDIVVNNVMSTSLTPDYSKYFFKDSVRYSVLIC
jgi:alpha-amylase